MSSENVINEIRESLNGRPGQPIVFGVCKALSGRFGVEPWIVRLAAIVLTLLWVLPAVAAYIVAGLVMKETEDRRGASLPG
jgi:phage shock protein PspC (stress-responsive transcriptional regulator)